MSEQIQGQQLLDIAEGCWSERRHQYVGIQFAVAVNQAMEPRSKGGPKRKVRRETAVHVTTTLFDHAREQSSERLSIVASQAGGDTVQANSASEESELYAFAAEVNAKLQGVSAGEFGVIDIGMIIGLIQSIIAAIAACKKPPVPAS